MKTLMVIGHGPWAQRIVDSLMTLEPSVMVLRPERGHDVWRAHRGAVDGVVIATSASSHAEIAVSCLQEGVPCCIEKPLALSVKDAERIEHAVLNGRNPDANVLVDHVDLFNASWVDFVIHARGAPRPFHLEIDLAGDGPHRKDVNSLWDYGAHGVAMALDFFGYAQPVSLGRQSTVDMSGHHLDLSFGELGHASINITSRATTKRRTARVGSVAYDGRAVPSDGVPPLTAALRAFVAGESNLTEAIEVVNVLEQCGPPGTGVL